VILEALGGGGNSTVAGGRVKESDPVTVRAQLMDAISDYLEK
jgi:c-di-AMP phosphodiesterase-like protein